ncbi:MAG: response regulator [Sphingomonadales bacterium]
MINLLLIDPTEATRLDTLKALKKTKLKMKVAEAATAKEGLAHLSDGAFDCAIVAAGSKNKIILGAMEKLAGTRSPANIPIIMLIDKGGESAALRFLNNNTLDYLCRDQASPENLTRAITKARALSALNLKLKKTQEKLKNSGENKSASDLTGEIAHDFNNLLTSIIASLRMASQAKVSEEAEKHIKEATEAAKRGADLTFDLLSFSQQMDLTSRVVEPNKIAKGVEGRIQKELGTTRDFTLKPSLKRLRVFVDPIEFETALVNLAKNACEAINDYGQVTISVSRAEVDCTREGEEDYIPGSYVLIEVKDTGIGMTETMQKKALDPMFTTKKNQEGAGVGLSTALGFIEQSDGYMKIESEFGHGTNVKLFLPVSEKVEEKEGMDGGKVGASDLDGKGKTVLLVEDDQNVLSVVGQALKAKKYSVLMAPDGDEAIEIIHGNRKIDLLVTDVFLPNNLSGKEVAKNFHHKFPQGGIIYVSGYHEDVVRDKISLGADGEILSKPYEINSLLLKMAKLLK